MNSINLTVAGKRTSINFNEHFSYLAKINESLNFGALDHYRKSGLTYVDVPEMVGITGACENVDTLFKVGNRLSLPLFFTQTGQLSLEQSLQSFPGCFTVIHSGRDEEVEDERHLRQFRLTEEEFDCTLAGMTRQNYDEGHMFAALLSHIQKAIQSMIKRILTDNKDVLKSVYRRDVTKLERAVETDFLRISYEEAIKLLRKNGYPNVSFGHDLKTEHEAKIIHLLNKGKTELPAFITRYPREIKFFNMKVSTQDPRVVLSADLIFPYAGEGTGSAVREHDFVKLKERLLTSTMYRLHQERGGIYEDFTWYMNIIRDGKTNPHAGYGIGNERVLQYVFAESDIRHVSPFSLLNEQTGDWSRERYGQAALHTTPKKHILLTIGKPEDKKYLLPWVKKLAKRSEYVLYATGHTHEFYQKYGILTSRVYKISEIGRQPNISDMLGRRVFDLIINIPTREKVREGKEFTDGKLIRKGAVDIGISLVTDPEVAATLMTNLTKKAN
ncbi:MAG: amino acid--tRNA ligase-related protein [Patescibacteria group bacterium]